MNKELQEYLRLIALLSVIFFISLIIRINWIAAEQYGFAQQYLQQKQIVNALKAYERSARAWLPFSSMQTQAANDMMHLNNMLEQTGHKEIALQGWRRLRGALLSTRSMFGQPNAELLPIINANIARLAASTDKQGMMSAAAIEKELAQLLSAPLKDVSPFWGLVQFVALIAWIIGILWLIWHWSAWSIKQRSLVMTASWSCFALWLLALSQA
ncbi:MAG: hypothetical protein R8L53_09225 [Mariprofundales bacterium]